MNSMRSKLSYLIGRFHVPYRCSHISLLTSLFSYLSFHISYLSSLTSLLVYIFSCVSSLISVLSSLVVAIKSMSNWSRSVWVKSDLSVLSGRCLCQECDPPDQTGTPEERTWFWVRVAAHKNVHARRRTQYPPTAKGRHRGAR